MIVQRTTLYLNDDPGDLIEGFHLPSAAFTSQPPGSISSLHGPMNNEDTSCRWRLISVVTLNKQRHIFPIDLFLLNNTQ